MKKLLFLLLVLAACSKDDPEPQPSRTELLTAHKWELLTVDGEMPDGGKTIYEFKQSEVVIIDYVDFGTTINGTWELIKDQLNISFAGALYEYSIIKIDAEEMILRDEQSQDHVYKDL